MLTLLGLCLLALRFLLQPVEFPISVRIEGIALRGYFTSSVGKGPYAINFTRLFSDSARHTRGELFVSYAVFVWKSVTVIALLPRLLIFSV